MKITHKQLRRIIKETYNSMSPRSKALAISVKRKFMKMYPDAVVGIDGREGWITVNGQKAVNMSQASGSPMSDDEMIGRMHRVYAVTQVDSDVRRPTADSRMDTFREGKMKITKRQLRRIIKEAMEEGPQFPDLSHPTIKQFADKTSGPSGSSVAKWFTSMQSYRYRAGGSSDQSITVYYLPNGQYMARVGGSYSNTLSNDRRAGKHADAISAIEAALDSSPSSSGPTARDLLKKVGEKVQSYGYIGQD